jgi:hypothetical protein
VTHHTPAAEMSSKFRDSSFDADVGVVVANYFISPTAIEQVRASCSIGFSRPLIP